MRVISQTVLSALLLSVSSFLSAQVLTSEKAVAPNQKYLVQIQLHTVKELTELLQKAKTVLENREDYPDFTPIALVLHGPEVMFFERKHYQTNKEMVDLAAKLDAFRIIDVRICETRMRMEGVEKSSLPPFVDTVPFGPAEETRLRNEGYIQF